LLCIPARPDLFGGHRLHEIAAHAEETQLRGPSTSYHLSELDACQ
jgi:hypothetical protein